MKAQTDSITETGGIQRILNVLSTYSFSLSDEKVLQGEISEVLDQEGIAHRREVRLNDKDIIDFIFDGGIGMEVKIKGQKLAIYRQLKRYATSDQINQLILLTSVSMGTPGVIEGKPTSVLSLSKAHL